ncbi:MAG: ABC transporter permease [Candidatus Sulfopaludibacter sp.]|nr:ABC transporter permease [Candidatus Sulfopaludibacter sp.]
MTVRRVVAGLAALLRKRRLDAELDSEILAHLELAQRDAVARGLSPEEARRAARLSFGGIEKMKEEHRDRRGFPWMETLLRDFSYGLAAVRRAPAFSAVVVGVLALGIGANVGMFSVVDAVLLKPLPFAAPERITGVWEAPRPGIVNATSAPDFLDWQRLATVFETLSAEQSISADLSGTGEPARLSGKEVTAGYFQVFTAHMQFGRTFTPDDGRPGAAAVIVLSHAAWQNYFAGDPDILQRRPILDGASHLVIGVLAPGAFDRDETRFWKPLIFTSDQLATRNVHWLTVYGRLRDGVTITQARERMSAIHTAMTEGAPKEDREAAIDVEPLERLLVGDGLQRSMTVAFGAVTLVLLIACANVANLLLAKGATRRRELAVRAALGAGRSRLVGQLFTESLVLCLLGGIAGVAVAALLLALARPVLADSIPFTAAVSLDFRVLAFAGAVALGVALLAGTLPALRMAFGNLAQGLNGSARGSSGAHSRMRRAIVVGEVALSLVLVSGALLLLRSLLKLQGLDTGIRIDHVITMSVDLPVGAYRTPPQAALFYQAAAGRLQAAPGVAQAGLSTTLPLEWISNGEAMQVPGVEKLVHIRFKRVDPGYFRTLGIPVLAGRGITAADIDGATRVMVINQALATRLADVAGYRDPIGKKVRVSCPGYVEKRVFLPEIEIAGVIRSERVASPGYPDPPVVYVPLAQAPTPRIKLVVRTRTEPGAEMPAIRQAIREIDASLPLGDVATMQQVRERTLSGASRPAWLIGVFAAISVLLAAIGLYGVVAHVVTQQRREIGIRMALGAGSGDVVSRVLRNALSMVAVGLAFGMAGAFALTRVIKSLLFEVSPLDPAALAIACATMTLIGLFAGLVPASRAARVDPVTTLRDEG